MKVIECRSVTKVYGRKKALNEISFTIDENKITGVIGRNGAGKTTMLKIIAGFFKHTSGEVKVFSEKPFNNLLVSANSIFIDDEMSLPSSTNLAGILKAAEKFYPNWNGELANRLYQYFSFDSSHYHDKLSKGMQSTFNMIVGLASRCPLTIFDEPTTGMDAGVRQDFYRALIKDYIAHPRTILISSHHLEEMENLLEDVLLIKNGQVQMHLPIEDMKEWAVRIKGKSDLVNNWTLDRDLLHIQEIGADTVSKVVKNDYTEAELQEIRVSGLELATVSASDLSVYLTRESKEGIDNVFNEAKLD